MNALVGLAGQMPNLGNEFSKGFDAAQGRQMNALRMQGAEQEMGRKQATWLMDTLAGAGLAALGGDINGTPDPQRWNQALDAIDRLGLGIDTASYRNNPGLAPTLVNMSLTAKDAIARAQNDRDFDLALKKFNFGVMDANRRYSLDQQKLAQDASTGPTTHGTLIPFTRPDGTFGLGLAPKAGSDLVELEIPGQPLNPYDTSRLRAEGKEIGEAAGKGVANLPKVEQQAGGMLATLDRLENHPGFSSAVGIEGNIPEWMIPAGTQPANFLSLLEQIQGQAFLQAFESLKGGGQITEIEGKKATQAITRLSRRLDEEEFKKAIGEIREVIQTGLERARRGISLSGERMNEPATASQPVIEDPLGIRY